MGNDKLKIVVLSVLLVISGLFTYGQNNQKSFSVKTLEKKAVKIRNTSKQIKRHVNEVFIHHANELVFQNPTRQAAIQGFFKRYFILEKALVSNEKIHKLSNIPLNNKYNSILQRDLEFNALEFNPLKYQLDFFPNTKKMYRIDNTNFVIIILPI